MTYTYRGSSSEMNEQKVVLEQARGTREETNLAVVYGMLLENNAVVEPFDKDLYELAMVLPAGRLLQYVIDLGSASDDGLRRSMVQGQALTLILALANWLNSVRLHNWINFTSIWTEPCYVNVLKAIRAQVPMTSDMQAVIWKVKDKGCNHLMITLKGE